MELEDGKLDVVDPEVRAYIYSLASALGGTAAGEDGNYVLGDDAIGCLKDLKRWLRLYDERINRLDVARCLAEANLVNGDLLPILASWREDDQNNTFRAKLALACLELLVPLTWPLEKDEFSQTRNYLRHMPYLQRAQLSYKRGILTFGVAQILRTAVRIALPSISVSRENRSRREDGIVKLTLYFLRNVAIISQPPNLPIEGDEEEVSRSSTIAAFHSQDVFALILTLASNISEDFNTQDVILMEIIYHLVKGVDVELLFTTEDERQEKKSDELKSLLQKETHMSREYARTAPSRHNRFGTMIWVKRNDEKVSSLSGQDVLANGQVALQKMDNSKTWHKPKFRGRNFRTDKADFDARVLLKSEAMDNLRTFVEEFLDSGFNPLFDSVRKAIEREADRVLSNHIRQFFYLVSWFLHAERVRRRVQMEKHKNMQQEFEADSFALVASVLNQETFVTLNRIMQSSIDNKEWEDIHACMLCFTQILLVIRDMAVSPLEEDQEIAENIQNRIFYEETTHDRVISIVRDYKDQGFGYLDACTELAHVFLRLVESYSKQNVDLQIRSRRRARKKKVEQEGQTFEGSDAEEDAHQADIISKERKFDFNRFAYRFVNQKVVDTFVKFARHYKELNPEQLKRAHRFFYRVAFKQEMPVVLYRLDIVALLHKMIKGPGGLPPKSRSYKEWEELSRQIFRRLIKKVNQQPELIVELLFSKMNNTLFYLQHGYENTPTTKRVPRGSAQLEVKPGRSHEDQISIVTSTLGLEGKHDILGWLKDTLDKAVKERKSWEDETNARIAMQAQLETDETNDSITLTQSPPIVLTLNTDDMKLAMSKDNKLRLLLELLGFERSGGEENNDTTWIIPSAKTSEELAKAFELVQRFEYEVPQECLDGKIEPSDLIRRKPPPRKSRAELSEESEGDSDFDIDALFPEGGPTVRKPDSSERPKKLRKKRSSKADEKVDVDEEVREARRKAREKANLEKKKKIKSDLFVHDSDDEENEERDRAFFAAEEERRKKQSTRVAATLAAEKALSQAGTKRKNLSQTTSISKRRKNSGYIGESTENSENDDPSVMSSRASSISRRLQSEEPLQDDELSSIAKSSSKVEEQADPDTGNGDEDEDEVVVAPQRRKRGGFVIEDDSDSE